MEGTLQHNGDWRAWEGCTVGDQFRLRKCLGSTPNYAVFRTERNDADAVIKFYRGDAGSIETQLGRWRAAAQIEHPNLIRLFEIGKATLQGTDAAYVVMESADEDLSQVDRALSQEEALEVLNGAEAALTYLHLEGMVHGRLKPSNMLAVGDQFKLSADSIRPAGEWNAALDHASPYSPPEVASQGALSQGDTWSLAVILVESLTRRMPSWESDPDEASLPGTLPRPFRDPIREALHKDPRERPTMMQFAADIKTAPAPAPAPLPASARPVMAAPQPSRWKPMAAVAGVALLVIAGYAMLHSSDDATSDPEIEITAIPEVAASDELPAAKGKPAANQNPEDIDAEPDDAALTPPARPVTPDPKAPVAKADPTKADAAQAKLDPNQGKNGKDKNDTKPVETARIQTAPQVAPAAEPKSAESKSAEPKPADPEPAPRRDPSLPAVVTASVMPDVPAKARNTIRGKVGVNVRVLVDWKGSVVDASNQSPEASRYFGNLAVSAARRWKFQEAAAGPGSGSRAWMLHFEFVRDSQHPVLVELDSE